LFGEAFPETIKIEHTFTLKFSEKWERPLRKWIDKCLDASKQYAESFHFIAVGIGSYFFFLGISKIVEASNASRGGSDDSPGTKKNRNKVKGKDKSTESTDTKNGSRSPSIKGKTKGQNAKSEITPSTIPDTTVIEAASSTDSEPVAVTEVKDD